MDLAFVMGCPYRYDPVFSSFLEVIAGLLDFAGIASGNFTFVNEFNALFASTVPTSVLLFLRRSFDYTQS